MNVKSGITRLCEQNLGQNCNSIYQCKLEKSKEMNRILKKLPNEYGVLFSMYISGFKFQEIAKKSGIPLNMVKRYIFFTRQHIQMNMK